MVFQKCCCCIELRAGAIALAILQVFGSFIDLAAIGQDGRTWLHVTNTVFGLAAGILLLGAAIKRNLTATLVYLVLDMINILFGVVCAIIMFVAAAQFSTSKDDVHALEELSRDFGMQLTNEDLDTLQSTCNMAGVGLVILAVISLYFWICIYSFYKNLKSGNITSAA